MSNDFKQIKSLEQLKKESNEASEFLIQLRGGLVSRKIIQWDEGEKKFFVTNCIDDTEKNLTEEQIMDEDYTNIGKSTMFNAFYKDLR
jgi:hypothetical protein